MQLDQDLQQLWDRITALESQSTVIDFQFACVQEKRKIFDTQESRGRNVALTSGISGVAALGGTNRDHLIESLYLTMVTTYMRPLSISATQTDAQMDAESSRNALRLRKAVWHALEAIKFTKASWTE